MMLVPLERFWWCWCAGGVLVIVGADVSGWDDAERAETGLREIRLGASCSELGFKQQCFLTSRTLRHGQRQIPVCSHEALQERLSHDASQELEKLGKLSRPSRNMKLLGWLQAPCITCVRSVCVCVRVCVCACMPFVPDTTVKETCLRIGPGDLHPVCVLSRGSKASN